MRTRIKIFWIRLTNWEYWPWQLVYVPIYVYWLWCAIKARAIFWFSAGNPGFEYGGIIGASKSKILARIPEEYLPKTIQIKPDLSIDKVQTVLERQGLHFPLIVKPDIGERGFHVALVEDLQELESYLVIKPEEHVIQEYLDMPIELGVFYYRFPNKDVGEVTSVVQKRLLAVTGDGKSTIAQLMSQDMRSIQQIARLKDGGKTNLEEVLTDQELRLLEPIGNHVRGTAFLDACDLINEELNKVFNNLALRINGFYYGRFDIRCNSLEDLYKGDFKVMEINGAASEPAHIYSPNYPILKGYRELFKHWHLLYRISRINHKRGVPYMSFKTGMEALRKSRFKR